MLSIKIVPEIQGETRKGGENMSKKSRRILALLNEPKHRASLLTRINRADQDDTARVGGDQEMKVLTEMNELQEFENDVWSPGRE
jgi:hypothetical protein